MTTPVVNPTVVPSPFCAEVDVTDADCFVDVIDVVVSVNPEYQVGVTDADCFVDVTDVVVNPECFVDVTDSGWFVDSNGGVEVLNDSKND